MAAAKKDQIVSGSNKVSKFSKTRNLSSSGEIEYPDNSIKTMSIPASDALHSSEKRFYTLYYQSPIAIEHYDKRGKLIDVNPSCLSLFGVKNLEDLKNFDLFADPNISEEHKKMLKRKEIVQYQGIFDFGKVRKSKLYPTKKTGKLWIDVSITPLLNNKDTIDGYLVQIIDITDRMIAIKTLRESEEKYRMLFENVQDVFYKIDINGNFMEISPSIKYFTEYDRDELLGQSVLNTYANPKDRKTFLNSLMKTGELRDYEVMLKSKTGKIIYASINARLITDKKNKTVYITGALRDITKRKQAEEALRKSEELFRSVVQNSSDLISLTDEKGILRYISLQCESVIGFPPEEFIGVTMPDIIHPDDKVRCQNVWNKVLSGEELKDFVYRIIDPQKRVKWISQNSKLIKNNGVQSTLRDITKQRMADDALRESEEKYRLLFDNASQAIVVAQGNVLQFVNRKACEVFGYSCEELLSIPFIEFVFDEDKQMIAENYKNRLLGNPAPQNYPFRILRKDKTIRWVEASVVLFQWMGKNASLNYLTDITDRKKAEEELKESNGKYQFIVENTNDILWIMNPDFTIDYVSPSVYKFLGYTPEEHVKQKIEDYLTPESVRMIIQEFQIGMMNLQKKEFDKLRNSADIEVEFIRKDKTKGFANINMVMARDENHNIIKIRGITSNITDRKKAEDKLLESIEQLRELRKYTEEVREMERLAISRELHDDLGQALTAVIIDLSMIKKKIPDQEIVHKIEKVSVLVGNTIKSIQQLTSNLRPDMINDLGLDDAIECYAMEFADRTGIHVSLNIDQGINFSSHTALNIFRILQESLTNIARHAKATKVDIMLKKTYESVCIKIIDNGKGVTEADLKSKKSFGIMSMKERAQSMGGLLDIYKKNKKGTEIELILPLLKI